MSRHTAFRSGAPSGAARVWLARLLTALAVASGAGAVAQAAAYVGDGLTDVSAQDKAVVANPQPVQLIFQFDTKGAPNARATKLLKQHVIDDLKATGAFAQISDGPTSNGAILGVTIDDVATPADLARAEGQGAVTGATFFIAGSNITEHYQSTLEYVASPTSPKITRTAQQAVIMQMGLINSPPEHAVKIGKMDDAIYTMVRQIIDNPLNEILKDPTFPDAAAPAAQTNAAAPAPASAASPTTTPAPASTDQSTAAPPPGPTPGTPASAQP